MVDVQWLSSILCFFNEEGKSFLRSPHTTSLLISRWPEVGHVYILGPAIGRGNLIALTNHGSSLSVGCERSLILFQNCLVSFLKKYFY